MKKIFDWSAGAPETVVAVLRRAAQEQGERPFIDICGDVYSFADIDRESSRYAHGLIALGVSPGQTIATILDNNLEGVLFWFAINKTGAVSVPVNTAFKGEFLRHQLADSGARLVVAESDYAQRVCLIAPQLPGLSHLIHRGQAPVQSAAHVNVLPLEAIRASHTECPAIDIKPTDLTMLVYTGGTTGPSKGCANSHMYMCALARQSVYMNGRTADTINWTALPLFHQNATVTSILAQLMVGGRVALYPRFSVSNFWPEIERTGANDVSLLGSMIPMLAKAPDNDAMQRCHGQVRYVGAAPFPAELQEIWRTRFGVACAGVPGYGLTEAAMVTLQRAGEPAPAGSSGRRNAWFDVRIVDDHDVELAPGIAGEVIVRPLKPHCMFEGYWNRPAETLKVMQNMWFHTGDIGKFDADGFFYFVDRKKDYLRRRGENISSYEMETTFRAHPAILDVAVHAVPSALTEDDVKVTVVLQPDAALTEQELCLWSIERLPYFAVPRYIEFRSELPRNPVGRVLKYELRDQGVTPRTWDIEQSGIGLTKR